LRELSYVKGHVRRIKFFNEYRKLPFIINSVAACVYNYCIDENDTYDFPEFYDKDIDNALNNTIIEESNRVFVFIFLIEYLVVRKC